jgi:hypothetical protein
MFYRFVFLGLLLLSDNIMSCMDTRRGPSVPFIYEGLNHNIQLKVIQQLHNPKMLGQTSHYNHAIVNKMIRDNFYEAAQNCNPKFLVSHYVPIILVDDDVAPRKHDFIFYTFHAIDLYDTKLYNKEYATHQKFQRIRKERYLVAIQNKKYQLGFEIDGKERIKKNWTYTFEGEVKNKNKFTLSEHKHTIHMKALCNASLSMPLLLSFLTTGVEDRRILEEQLIREKSYQFDDIADYLKIMINVEKYDLFEMLLNYFIALYESIKTVNDKQVTHDAYNHVINTYYDLLFLADKHNKTKAFQMLCLQVPGYIKNALLFKYKGSLFTAYYDEKDIANIKHSDNWTVLDFMLYDGHFNKDNITYFKKNGGLKGSELQDKEDCIIS